MLVFKKIMSDAKNINKNFENRTEKKEEFNKKNTRKILRKTQKDCLVTEHLNPDIFNKLRVILKAVLLNFATQRLEPAVVELVLLQVGADVVHLLLVLLLGISLD